MKLLLGHEKAQQNGSKTLVVAGKVSDRGNSSLEVTAFSTGNILRSIEWIFDKLLISLVLSAIYSGREGMFSS